MRPSNEILRGVCLSLTLALVGILGSPAPARAELGALVPAYFYPAGSVNLGYWSQLDQAAQRINVDVIVNPANGPGTATDSNYLAQIQALNTTPHGEAFGYIATGFGARPLGDVETDIQRWISLYVNKGGHLAGFFIDQMSILPGTLSFYQDIYNYTKSLSSYTVIGNPGIPFQNGVSATDLLSTADVLNIFEGPNTDPDPTAAQFAHYPYGLNWFQGFPSSRFSNIVFGVPDEATMRADLNKAVSLNAGLVYFTDGTNAHGNPYDHLPSYWDQEVAAIQAINLPEPGPLTKLASGGLFAALGMAVQRWRRRRARA
jgi:hypothetical protein